MVLRLLFWCARWIAACDAFEGDKPYEPILRNNWDCYRYAPSAQIGVLILAQLQYLRRNFGFFCAKFPQKKHKLRRRYLCTRE
jgi:hypothetical protein